MPITPPYTIHIYVHKCVVHDGVFSYFSINSRKDLTIVSLYRLGLAREICLLFKGHKGSFDCFGNVDLNGSSR